MVKQKSSGIIILYTSIGDFFLGAVDDSNRHHESSILSKYVDLMLRTIVLQQCHTTNGAVFAFWHHSETPYVQQK